MTEMGELSSKNIHSSAGEDPFFLKYDPPGKRYSLLRFRFHDSSKSVVPSLYLVFYTTVPATGSGSRSRSMASHSTGITLCNRCNSTLTRPLADIGLSTMPSRPPKGPWRTATLAPTGNSNSRLKVIWSLGPIRSWIRAMASSGTGTGRSPEQSRIAGKLWRGDENGLNRLKSIEPFAKLNTMIKLPKEAAFLTLYPTGVSCVSRPFAL